MEVRGSPENSRELSSVMEVRDSNENSIRPSKDKRK